MKRTLFLLSWIFIAFDASAQIETSKQREAFVQHFMEYVEEHKKWKTRRSLNKKYRKKQLAFLSGNKNQFFNELFSGEDAISGNYVTINYHEIVAVSIVEVAEITEGNNTAWIYVFKVSDGKHEARCPLLLEKRLGKFGFIGAVG